jgi:predicted O-methyltransferase YrrM
MKSLLKSAAKKVMPASTWQRVKSLRDTTRQFDKAWRHAKATTIEFHSGLADSSSILYGLVRSLKPEVCVEIGSARGNSTCAMAMALKENGHGKLYAIDPHMPTDWNDHFSVDTFEVLQGNISSLGLVDQVEIVRSLSGDVAVGWTRPIDLIFIDGDHSYAGVKQDWDMFVKHVAPFGVVVFHDTIWDIRPPREWDRVTMGVPRFVDELRQQGYQIITLDRDCGVSMVQPTIGGVPLRPVSLLDSDGG